MLDLWQNNLNSNMLGKGSFFKLSLPFFIFVLVQCSPQKQPVEEIDYNYPDTLRVGTLYSPTSYFQYRDNIMGYDYSLIQDLANEKDLKIELKIFPSITSIIESLDSGFIDLAAFDIPVTGETLARIIPCGYQHMTHQILVQKKGIEQVMEVTDLIGRDVYVEGDTKYFYRLENLNEELGGGINIHIISQDSIISEDILDMVADNTIPLTVVDSDIARLNKVYFPELDFSVQISFPQRSSWAVPLSKPWLADSIDNWFNSRTQDDENKWLLRRYFEMSRIKNLDFRSFTRNFNNGYISEYDNLLKKYSQTIDWDWRLLASMCYAESRFDNSVVSWAGAKGIMQIMPSTGRAFGYNEDQILQPEKNIEVATKIINSLDKSLMKYVNDPEERIKFIIAAYNSGLAHVLDAISIASAYNYEPTKWEGNVAEALKLKSVAEVYNNPEICKYGYFKGNYTTEYVKNVLELYKKAQSAFPNNSSAIRKSALLTKSLKPEKES